MPKNKKSHGAALARKLDTGRAAFEQNNAGDASWTATDLSGITRSSGFTKPIEKVLSDLADSLCSTQRIYRYGDDIVLEICGDSSRLVPIQTGQKVSSTAPSMLTRYVTARTEKLDPKTNSVRVERFSIPKPVLEMCLNTTELRRQFPVISVYAQRSVYDSDYNLLGPGYHADQKVLVHGPNIEPVPFEPSSGGETSLPPLLSRVLRSFCWRSRADLENALAALLTGLLANRFIEAGKPLVVLDGNQPSVGKTLFARVMGVLLDGRDPQLLHYTANDEELGKRVCALLRAGGQSLLCFDNAKLGSGIRVESTVIEANSMAPEIVLRILGRSANLQRPNDLLWVLTMNSTRVSPDLVSRALPLRLSYDGDPRERDFGGFDPIGFTRKHRLELLGELAGMVVAWNQAGRPVGEVKHRLTSWADIVGGILRACGFTEFLGNLREADADFDVGRDDLGALAEHAIAVGLPFAGRDSSSVGAPAGRWLDVFMDSDILVDRLVSAKSNRARSMLIGNFLRTNLDRTVPVEVGGASGTATLVSKSARSNQTSYGFLFELDAEQIGQAPGNVVRLPSAGDAGPDQQHAEFTGSARAVGDEDVDVPF